MTVTVSVADFLSDVSNLSAYGSYTIVDTEANIVNNLSALNADAFHVAAVQTTDSPIVLSAYQVTYNNQIISKFSDDFTVSDTGELHFRLYRFAAALSYKW